MFCHCWKEMALILTRCKIGFLNSRPMVHITILRSLITVYVETKPKKVILATKIETRFDIAVNSVKNCMHDAILTATKNEVIPRVEMAVGSVSG